MNLNNMGTGQKLINQIINKTQVQKMGWTPTQQMEKLNKQPNPHSIKTRIVKK